MTDTDLSELVTADDIAALSDGDNGDLRGNADSAPADKFDGDPDKLAKSYGELEKKLGQQGSELGEVKRLLQQMITDSKSDDESGEGDGFLKDLEAQMEQGNLTVSQAFKNLYEHLKGDFDSKFDERDQAASRNARNAQIWDGFVKANPEAEKLEDLMVKIGKAKPHLIRTDGSEQEVMDSLNDVLTLAKDLVRKASSKAGRSRGSMDSGQSRRVNPRGLTRGSRASDMFDKARQTDNERDWGSVLEELM